MATKQTLDEAVRRLRAGKVNPAPTTQDPRESEMVRVVSAALLAWSGQLERLDRFSLPLLPSGSPTGERADATTTSQLFLEQTASDYRRVASPELNLQQVEEQRKSSEGRRALKRAKVANQSVAPLAVGQYLVVREEATQSHLLRALQPWIFADQSQKPGEAFGEVLGPLVLVGLDTSDDHTSMVLPDWSSHVGNAWCKEFLIAGSEILKDPSLLSSSQIEGGQVLISSRAGLVDATETINHVVALAEAFRPVEDVRVSVAGNEPKIDIVFAPGEELDVGEFRQFMTSVQGVPADVMILPNVPGNATGHGAVAGEVQGP